MLLFLLLGSNHHGKISLMVSRLEKVPEVSNLTRTSEATMDDIGLTPQKPSAASILATEECWNYTSFKTKNVPAPHPRNQEGFSPIYRGVVPAKNLFKRDFAINGAIVIIILFDPRQTSHTLPGSHKQRVHLGNNFTLDLVVFPWRSIPQFTTNNRGRGF